MRCVRAAAAFAGLALGVGASAPAGVAAGPGLPARVDLGGRPVESSTNSAAPTVIGPGLWTVRLGPQSQPQYFTYERRIKDSTIHVGVIGAPEIPDGDGVDFSTSVPGTDNPAPIDCGGDYASTDFATPHGLVGAHETVGDESDAACRSADSVIIMVRRYHSTSDGELPIAIKIVEEAPATDTGEPLPEDEELSFDVPRPTDAADGPQGAGTFDDAPVLDARDGPVTIAVDVPQGGELLWRVPLDWGDRIVARADLAATEDEQVSGTTVQVRLVHPDRDVFAPTTEDYSYADFGVDDTRAVVGTYPLRYTNRYDDLLPALPGDHWVAIAAEPPRGEDQDAVDVPVDLTVEVTSDDVAPPRYQGAVVAQDGDAGPPGYSPDTPFLIGEGEFSAVASGNPLPTEPADDDEWWGPRRAAGIGVGIVGIACCVAGLLWLRVRRAAASR